MQAYSPALFLLIEGNSLNLPSENTTLLPMHLGLDLSTQSCSATLIDPEQGTILYEGTINFGKDLPHYGCPNGYIPDGKNGKVHAPPLMWLEALDLLLSKMKKEGVDLQLIRGISGSGQQHASVYLNDTFHTALSTLDSNTALHTSLKETLSRETAPIWMDSSTSAQCQQISATVGGNEEVCAKSGSIAIERFSGAQVRKFSQESPEAYAQTSTIHLASSFLCSVLLGKSASIDKGDGAGMNLLNLSSEEWDKNLMEATAPELEGKLPPIVDSSTILGEISPYFIEKYGFAEGCKIMAWSGDNPCSLVGMGASTPGTAVISLGTSDTFFAAMPKAVTDPNGYGHVFGNPTGGFMSLICFLNGSLAREAVKETNNLTWKDFEKEALSKTPAGNEGKMMLPFYGNEITPKVSSSEPTFNMKWSEEDKNDPSQLVRATLEGQFLNMKVQSEWMGIQLDQIRVTGGASQNEGICQVISNVFGCPISRLETTGSAGLGAAIKSAIADEYSLSDLEEKFCQTSGTIHPETDAVTVYKNLEEEYKDLLKTV